MLTAGYEKARRTMRAALNEMAPHQQLVQVDEKQKSQAQFTSSLKASISEMQGKACQDFYSFEKNSYKDTCEKMILVQEGVEDDYCSLAQSEGSMLQNRMRGKAFSQQEVCQAVYIIELMDKMTQYLKDILDGDRTEEINRALQKVKLSQKQAKCAGNSKAAGKYWYWILQQVTKITGLSSAKLVYRATKNKGSAAQNRMRWWNLHDVLIVIRSNYNQVFGGYYHLSNLRKQSYINEKLAHGFLFQANKHKIIHGKGAQHYGGGRYSTYRSTNYWPTFGGGHDLYVNAANPMGSNGYSNFGHSYNCPVGRYGSVQCKKYLAGAYSFRAKEMEIFGLKK